MEDIFIHLTTADSLQVILIGFIGGVLSGFIGSGGAFFMTPGMMNIGVQGVIAVGSNITHKFGKALIGSRKHGEMGHVDKKLGIFMLITSLVGIWLAVLVMSHLFGIKSSHGDKGAAANLYISLIFVVVLFLVSVSMLRDIIRKRTTDDTGPSKSISEYLTRLNLCPMIYFPVADVKISLWILMIVGLATGYLAGTIGVGGFIGVPAMIYVFGVPTAVATGTELFLAMFMGAFGAINYALKGFVDIRLVALLYLGSLLGIYIGAYGTKVVREKTIRLVTGLIILLCVISRAIAVPIYLDQLNIVHWIGPSQYELYNSISKGLLYTSGISGVLIILTSVIKAYIKRRRVQASFVTKT